MKGNLFFGLSLVILLISERGSAQILSGTPMDSAIVRFTSDSISGFIPDTATRPLWQIGHSHKAFFGTDSVGITTIMTDTARPYPINANNWFVMKIGPVFNVIVDFWHKFQTDSGHAGGVVEFSLDRGITWQNVKGACNRDGMFHEPGVYTENFYSDTDTLTTGEPAFMGLSNSPQYSRFQFFVSFPMRTTSGAGCYFEVGQIYIRFRFLSDSTPDSLAGWIIDSIKTERNDYGGSVARVSKPALNIYPNPSYDGIFVFPPLPEEQSYMLQIYNYIGECIERLPYGHQIDLSQYAVGLYFYRIANGSDEYIGKLQKE